MLLFVVEPTCDTSNASRMNMEMLTQVAMTNVTPTYDSIRAAARDGCANPIHCFLALHTDRIQ